MASTALPRPLLSLLRAGVLLAVAATALAAQTEFPFAAGTDSTGRAQAVSDAAGRVLIESPEFPRGLWVDLVDEAGQALAGIQVEYEGRPDSLVALRCVDPAGLRQETLLWTRPKGEPLSMRLKSRESVDAVPGLTLLGWRIDQQAENLLEPDGPPLTSWEELTAFLQEHWQGRTGRVVVQIDSSTALAVDLADAEPVVRVVGYLRDRARMSLGRMNPSLVQVLLSPHAIKPDLALFEAAIVLPTSFILVPGSELEKWVLKSLGWLEGPVTLAKAASLTQLSVEFSRIADVTPLASLFGLRWLNLYENEIVDVGPLAALTGMNHLGLGANRIVDVAPLAALTGLGRLDLHRNQIVDVSPLAALTGMKDLGLGANRIVDVTPLASLTRLEKLGLGGNQIVDLSPLAALTGLGSLNLYQNRIVDVTPLATLTRLEKLGLGGNQIVDLSPLAALINLKRLYLGSGRQDLEGNAIADLSPLASLTKLEDLILRTNEIVDVSPLAALTSLEYLALGYKGMDVSSLVALTGVLAALTSLKDLSLSRNEIVDVSPLADLASLTNLEALVLDSNKIVDVSPLAALTNLEMLALRDNEIVDVTPLASLTNLKRLFLEGNSIQDISSLTANTGLDRVQLKGNPLSDEAINEQIPALKAQGVSVTY